MMWALAFVAVVASAMTLPTAVTVIVAALTGAAAIFTTDLIHRHTAP